RATEAATKGEGAPTTSAPEEEWWRRRRYETTSLGTFRPRPPSARPAEAHRHLGDHRALAEEAQQRDRPRPHRRGEAAGGDDPPPVGGRGGLPPLSAARGHGCGHGLVEGVEESRLERVELDGDSGADVLPSRRPGSGRRRSGRRLRRTPR